MWVKVDDSFAEHPKVIEAGRHLGASGRGRVVAIWLVAMCHCNRNLTDGFIDEATVRTWTLYDKRPLDVALVMADAGLMKRIDGGFRFHDYHDYQPSAEEVKAKKRKDRDRKREERRRKLLGVTDFVHADTSGTSEGILARSRARDPDLGLSTGTHHEDPAALRAPACGNPVDRPDVLEAMVYSQLRAAVQDKGPGIFRDSKDVYDGIRRLADRSRPPIVYAQAQFDDLFSTALTVVEQEWQRGKFRRAV